MLTYSRNNFRDYLGMRFPFGNIYQCILTSRNLATYGKIYLKSYFLQENKTVLSLIGSHLQSGAYVGDRSVFLFRLYYSVFLFKYLLSL